MLINTIKSIYYGHEVVRDGYICTEWATFIFVPLFPVASYFIGSSHYDRIGLMKLPKDVEVRRLDHIHRPHIIAGYTATGFVLIGLLLLPYFFE